MQSQTWTSDDAQSLPEEHIAGAAFPIIVRKAIAAKQNMVAGLGVRVRHFQEKGSIRSIELSARARCH